MSTTNPAAATHRPLGLDSLSEPKTYAHYRRLFASALSRLAATGFAAPPDEGLDLIHGFFVDLWSDVAPRYDPARAKFDTYMFGCFVNYARPRIVRLGRARRLLAEPALIERALASTPAPDEHETEVLDLATMRRAVGRLPALARSLLVHYLDDETPSERDLGARFGLTRYEVRMQLSNAIAGVMIEMGETGAFDETDRSVAHALFRERRTPEETAKILRRSATAIREARARWLGLLIQAVKGTRRMQTTRRAPPFVERTAAELAAHLLIAALQPESGANADAAVREHRELIWQFLESPDAERVLKPYAETQGAQLARVYALLADLADTGPAIGGAEYAGFLQTRDSDERSVGKAFDALVSGLGQGPAELRAYFKGLREIEVQIQDGLYAAPSVEAAGAPAMILVRYGITPVIIAEATESISSLALRFCRINAIETDHSFILEGRESALRDSGPPILQRKAAIENLARGIDLPHSVLQRIYDWTWDAAKFAIHLFEDFEVCLEGDPLTLTRIERLETDLYKRWSANSEPLSARSARS